MCMMSLGRVKSLILYVNLRIKWYNLHVKFISIFLQFFLSPFSLSSLCLYLVCFFVVVVAIYTLSARPKLLKWIWFDDVTLLILLVLLFRLGLFILLLLAFNLNLFVLMLLPATAAPHDGGVDASDMVDACEKWYAEFCTEVQLPSSFDLMNNGCSILRPLSQPPKFILSQWPLFGNRFLRNVPIRIHISFAGKRMEWKKNMQNYCIGLTNLDCVKWLLSLLTHTRRLDACSELNSWIYW